MKKQAQPTRIVIPLDLTLAQCDQLAEAIRDFARQHPEGTREYQRRLKSSKQAPGQSRKEEGADGNPA